MRRILPGGLVFILLALSLGCGRDGGKAPTVLQATPEAVVLIRDNEARCAKIGQDGAQRLAAAEMEAERDIRALASYRLRSLRDNDSSLEPSSLPVQPSEVFKKYLAEDAVEELAASDAAQALIQGLLPEVKAEASPEMADAVAALSAAHDQVCLSIRQPRRSSQYQTTIDFAENDKASNPHLDITSTANYQDLTGTLHIITLTIFGTLDQPQWDLKTSTGYNKSQTLTLLFLGRNPEQLRRSLGDQSLGADPTRIDRCSVRFRWSETDRSPPGPSALAITWHLTAVQSAKSDPNVPR